MTVPLVYIAGPYRAATESRVRSNIERAREASEVVWQCGAFALCPHLNTAWMGGVVPDGEFLRRDLAAMARCDAVMAIEGWKLSEGAKAEVAEAKRLKIPVFDELLELRRWVGRWRQEPFPPATPVSAFESDRSACLDAIATALSMEGGTP